MSLVTLVPKYHQLGEGFSKREQFKALEHPGRRTDGTQSAAHWITSLGDRKHVILLCSFCRGKFNPRRNGYRKMYVADLVGGTDGHCANGYCDACKCKTIDSGGGTAFIAEETYNLVNIDPLDAKRKARMASRAAWATRRAPEAAGRKD